MNILHIEADAIGGGNITITDKNTTNHLVKVLRSKIGDSFKVSDGNGWEYLAEIQEIDSSEVILAILDKQKSTVEPRVKITLFQGIPKSDKMDSIVQKTVEVGVSSIVPVFMDRTIVKDKGNMEKKISRWNKISSEAVKQCGRNMVPNVDNPLNFNGMIEKLKGFDLVVFPYENEENVTIKNLLYDNVGEGKSIDLSAKKSNIAIVIGPEGGFSSSEAELLEKSGYKGVSLGKTILRTETAGVVAISMCMYHIEL